MSEDKSCVSCKYWGYGNAGHGECGNEFSHLYLMSVGEGERCQRYQPRAGSVQNEDIFQAEVTRITNPVNETLPGKRIVEEMVKADPLLFAGMKAGQDQAILDDFGDGSVLVVKGVEEVGLVLVFAEWDGKRYPKIGKWTPEALARELREKM